MKICFQLLSMILLLGFANPAAALLKAGDPAPDFAARTLDDREIRLSELGGGMLLIEMGTTWCPSCTEQARQIDTIRPFLKKHKVSYVTVYLADSASSISAHLKDEGLSWPDKILIDSGEARRRYGIFSIPRLLLIDKDFRIVFDGMTRSATELKRLIRAQTERQ